MAGEGDIGGHWLIHGGRHWGHWLIHGGRGRHWVALLASWRALGALGGIACFMAGVAGFAAQVLLRQGGNCNKILIIHRPSPASPLQNHEHTMKKQ